ncbi:MAG: transposase family protein [bacterium]
MPAKASKKHPLTFEQKQNNRIISGVRVISEHAISGYKRFKAASDVYRNKLENMDDKMNLVCAGLWNLHLEQTV